MSPQLPSQLRQARRAAARGVRYGEGLAIRARSRTAKIRRSYVPGLLSIVVPAYNVEEYLEKCLVSLREGEYRTIEIIVVDDGSPDRCAEIAREQSRRDPRVRLVRKENGGLGAARNTGIEHARGEFLTFVDSDDVVTSFGYRLALDALARSGSDFVVMNYDRLRRGKLAPAAPWIRQAHARTRLGTTIEAFPEALVNAVAWSKVYRRSFFDEAGLRFPEGVLYEDQVVSAEAFAKARAFDVLPQVLVHWRIREDSSSISQKAYTRQNLHDHQDQLRASLEVLTEAGKPQVAAQRRVQLLTNNMGIFSRDLVKADQGYWDELRLAITELFEGADLDHLRHLVDAQDKVLYRLILADERDQAIDFLGNQGASINRHRATVTPDGVRVDLPVQHPGAHDAAILSDRQLAFTSRVLTIDFSDEGDLRLRGWMFIAHLDLDRYPSDLTLHAVDAAGTRVELTLERYDEFRADLSSGHFHANYAPSGFRTVIPRAQLEGLTGQIHFEGTVTTADIVRSGRLDELSMAGSAQLAHQFVVGDHRLLVQRVRGEGLVVLSEEVLPNAQVMQGASATGAATSSGDAWLLTFPRGRSQKRERMVRATGVEVDDEIYRVQLEITPTLSDARVEMYHGGKVFAGELSGSGTSRTATFSLTRDHWGRTGLALPAGKYSLRLVAPNGDRFAVRPTYALLRGLPDGTITERYRVIHELEGGQYPCLALNLAAPLTPEESGSRNQQRLRDEFNASTAVADADAFFFRSLYGEVTNCNSLGVHEELGARGSDLTRYWSIKDHSVAVPEGGVGLVEGSRAWYEAMYSARFHMVNVHQLVWFAKPQGQQLIETMHGYPYKIMGHDWWDKGPFGPHQVATYDARARDWDWFVSPATYATGLLTKAFLEPAGATAEVLEIGYPRNDVLLDADRAPAVRERTRALIGAAPEQKVVLYAPTFRDYLAVNDMKAELLDLLDVEATAQQLGPEYLILVRGHAFNARADLARKGEGSGQIVDVTDYPEINDLILASDLAVLDFSSLRFDYGLTDKPMVFLVPDLEKYDEFRGGVIEYGPTAPGPQVRTSAEAIEWLRDPERLDREYADARATFRREYTDLDDGHASARLLDRVLR